MKKYIIYAACILALAWGCNSNKGHDHSEHTEAHDHDHDHADEHEGHSDDEHSGEAAHDHGDDAITLSTQQAEMMGVETEEVVSRPFHQVIKTSGQVIAAQGEEKTVVASVSGIVSYAKAGTNEGKAVGRGEALFSISAGNLAEGDPVTKARSTYEIAKRDFERAEALIVDKLISQKEYNEIQLAYANAKIAYDAIGGGGKGRGAVVSSPIGGYIKSILVTEGQFVNVGEPLMVVTQNNKLQLRADVSERYYKDLQGIQSANFQTPYDDAFYKLADMNGKLLSYGKSSNTNEHYIPVNFQFDNVGNILPGAYVEVFLLSGQKENTISVPKTALTDELGNYFVYVKICVEEYERRLVRVGATDGDRVEILEGLHVGDQVVTKGAYYVKLAAGAGSIPDSHHHH